MKLKMVTMAALLVALHASDTNAVWRIRSPLQGDTFPQPTKIDFEGNRDANEEGGMLTICKQSDDDGLFYALENSGFDVVGDGVNRWRRGISWFECGYPDEERWRIGTYEVQLSQYETIYDTETRTFEVELNPFLN